MRFFDVGQEAHGFFAFGQMATGVIAVGQIATGVIAIGQVARGVVAIGQVSFGLVFGVGMGSVSLGPTFAMVGLGGIRGKGMLLVRVIPNLGNRRVVPETSTLAHLQAQASSGGGWVAVTCSRDQGGAPVLLVDGRPLPVKIDHRAAGGVLERAGSDEPQVLARIERRDSLWVCERLMRVPPPPYRKKGFGLKAAAQLVAVVIIAAAWWVVVGVPLIEAISSM